MKRKIEFEKGSLRKLVYDYVITKKLFTLEDVYKKFPKENRNTLRGILSLFITAGLLKLHAEYEYVN